MLKLSFSGHESFNCKPQWLTKGYNFVNRGFSFNENDAVVHLGVGKNMVGSIRYWLYSFGITNKNNKLSSLSDYLFGENGKDKFLENPASLWLLHYQLVKLEFASIYSLFFNDFRKYSPEFTSKQLTKYILRICSDADFSVSENTIKRDVNVFLKNYTWQKSKSKDIEDEFSSLFIDLNLIEKISFETYRIKNNERDKIPKEVILFTILDQNIEKSSLSFFNVLNEQNSPGSIFAMTEEGLYSKILEITNSFKDIVFSDVAGIKEIQFKDEIDKWEVLNKYYEK